MAARHLDRLDDLLTLWALELGEFGNKLRVLLGGQVVAHRYTAAGPDALRLATVFRLCAESSSFRSRTFAGVSSTHSSSSISSSAWSRDSDRGGISRTSSLEV